MVKTTAIRKESIWTRGQPKERVIRELAQVQNTKSVARDAARPAKLPGLRISKNGNKYWESRSNRSDKRGKRL